MKSSAILESYIIDCSQCEFNNPKDVIIDKLSLKINLKPQLLDNIKDYIKSTGNWTQSYCKFGRGIPLNKVCDLSPYADLSGDTTLYLEVNYSAKAKYNFRIEFNPSKILIKDLKLILEDYLDLNYFSFIHQARIKRIDFAFDLIHQVDKLLPYSNKHRCINVMENHGKSVYFGYDTHNNKTSVYDKKKELESKLNKDETLTLSVQGKEWTLKKSNSLKGNKALKEPLPLKDHAIIRVEYRKLKGDNTLLELDSIANPFKSIELFDISQIDLKKLYENITNTLEMQIYLAIKIGRITSFNNYLAQCDCKTDILKMRKLFRDVLRLKSWDPEKVWTTKKTAIDRLSNPELPQI